MLNLNQLTNYELIDISKYKTDLVTNITRAYLVKYGRLVFFEFVGIVSDQGLLFNNLPYTPIFLTELNYISSGRISGRSFISTEGHINISYLDKKDTIYINGVYFTDN